MKITINELYDVVKQRDKLREALSSLLSLVEKGALVRNMDGDGDITAFVLQGMDIVSAIEKSQAALFSANVRGEVPRKAGTRGARTQGAN